MYRLDLMLIIAAGLLSAACTPLSGNKRVEILADLPTTSALSGSIIGEMPSDGWNGFVVQVNEEHNVNGLEGSPVYQDGSCIGTVVGRIGEGVPQLLEVREAAHLDECYRLAEVLPGLDHREPRNDNEELRIGEFLALRRWSGDEPWEVYYATVADVRDGAFVCFSDQHIGQRWRAQGPCAYFAFRTEVIGMGKREPGSTRICVLGEPVGIVWYDNGSILWGRAGLFPETVKLAVRFSVTGEILGERRVNVAWNSEGTAVIDCLRVMMWTQDVDGIGAVSYKVESRNWEKSNNVIAKEDGKLRELVLEDLRRVVTENGGWNVVDEFRISIDVR